PVGFSSEQVVSRPTHVPSTQASPAGQKPSGSSGEQGCSVAHTPARQSSTPGHRPAGLASEQSVSSDTQLPSKQRSSVAVHRPLGRSSLQKSDSSMQRPARQREPASHAPVGFSSLQSATPPASSLVAASGLSGSPPSHAASRTKATMTSRRRLGISSSPPSYGGARAILPFRRRSASRSCDQDDVAGEARLEADVGAVLQALASFAEQARCASRRSHASRSGRRAPAGCAPPVRGTAFRFRLLASAELRDAQVRRALPGHPPPLEDRKSTRLNSSH